MKLTASDTFEPLREPWGDYPSVIGVCLSFFHNHLTRRLTLHPADYQAGYSTSQITIYNYTFPLSVSKNIAACIGPVGRVGGNY